MAKMVVEIRIGDRNMGRAEMEAMSRYGNGDSKYEVEFHGMHKERFLFHVRHDRRNGAWGLATKVCRRAKLELDRFYSYPKEKATKDGLIPSGDIPARYRKDFGKWFGVGTCSVIPRMPCPVGCLDLEFDKKDETGIN